MRSAVALACVLALLAALVYFLVGAPPSHSAGPAAPADHAAATTQGSTEAARGATRPEPVTTSSGARTPAAAAAGSPPGGIEDGAKAHGPALDLATRLSARYDGFDAEDLAVELARLEREVVTALAGEFRALFEAGSFTEIPVEEGEARTLEQIAAAAERDGELCESHFVFESAAPPAPEMRPRAVRVACLAPREHPELEALIAERDWLRKKVAGER